MFGGFLLAGAGGFLGAGLRHLLYVWLGGAGAAPALVTFAVNVLGSFCIGWLGPFWLSAQHPARVFLVVGVLGGFTTFSTFSYDLLHLLQGGRWGWALAYGLGGVCLCLAAAWGGFLLHTAWK